jgi:hypothetical protein
MTTQIDGISRPDHVAESQVYDFDMFLDAALLTDPHKRLPCSGLRAMAGTG